MLVRTFSPFTPTIQLRHLTTNFASCMLPDQHKILQGGEDAVWFSSGQSQLQGLCVADGVGGWARMGVSSKEFAWDFVSKCAESIQNQQNRLKSTPPSQSFVVPDSVEILKRAHQAMIKKSMLGSCTALLAILMDNKLTGGHIGDSCLAVFRMHQTEQVMETVFKTTAVQHSFNFPIQVDASDEKIDETWDKAQKFVVELKAGDIILACTDGFFDNLYEDHVQKMIAQYLAETLPSWQDARKAVLLDPQLEYLCVYLATEALRKSYLLEESPFSKDLRAIRPNFPPIGKRDDISLIVGRVSE